jgi:hypothetical protein
MYEAGPGIPDTSLATWELRACQSLSRQQGCLGEAEPKKKGSRIMETWASWSAATGLAYVSLPGSEVGLMPGDFQIGGFPKRRKELRHA